MWRSYRKALLLVVITLGISAGVSVSAITADTTIPTAHDVATTTAYETMVIFDLSGVSNDSGTISFATTSSPAHGALGAITGTTLSYTPHTGFSGTDSFQFIVTEGATSSSPATVTITVGAPPLPTGTVQIVVRSGSIVATSSLVSFPLVGTTTVTTTLGTSHEVAASSTLAVLAALDVLASEFALTDLQYNTLFGSFYLRCITVAATTTSDCDNWQYTVNGMGPAVGMDKQVLHNGDVVYVYFGYPRIVELSAVTAPAGTAVTATAKQYDPVNGVYTPTPGYTLGATQPNPADPWNPLEIATSTVNSSGQAIFTLTATGTYAIGIKEDYYFPTVDLTITSPVTPPSGGGGGGSTPPFDVARALGFLALQQKPDGSFSSPAITDWAAIALAQYPGTTRDNVREFIIKPQTLSSVTDYERHAMALQALGINPYTGTSVDTIAPIVAAFDGTQIGDAGLVTDDIFALFPLLHAGYTQNDSLIRSIATFIISKQKPDGSWDGGAEVTAAAVQALGPLFTVPGSGKALGKASGYIASQQQPDGGWGSPDATSWVLTMINSVNEGDPAHAQSWTNSLGKKPIDSLSALQATDGGIHPSSGLADWSTSYAIVAASGKSWISILENFSKPNSAAGAGGGSSASTTTATSTVLVATSTVVVVSETITATSTDSLSATSSAPITQATTTPTKKVTPPKKKVPKKITTAPVDSILSSTNEEQPGASTHVANAAAPSESLLERFWSWLRGIFTR